VEGKIMHVARAVLYDFCDLGRGSTLRLLNGSNGIVLQGYLPGCGEAARDVCLAIAVACDVPLEVVGSPATVHDDVAPAKKIENLKGKSTGQCLLF